MEGAMEGTLDQVYTHVASLDFSNAFNSLDRRDIADGLRRHAKMLYRTGRWAYSAETDLVVGDTQLLVERCSERRPSWLPPLLGWHSRHPFCPCRSSRPSSSHLGLPDLPSCDRVSQTPPNVFRSSVDPRTCGEARFQHEHRGSLERGRGRGRLGHDAQSCV